jgi:translation initiation factor 5B
MAEIRKQALLASGAQIEGLQQGAGAPSAKKVVYGNRKKKGPTANISPASSRPRSPESVSAVAPSLPPPAEEPAVVAGGGAKDDWDASTDDEAAKNVKDDWDDSSDEEVSAPPPTEKATPAPTLTKPQTKGELVELLTEVHFTEVLHRTSSSEACRENASANQGSSCI